VRGNQQRECTATASGLSPAAGPRSPASPSPGPLPAAAQRVNARGTAVPTAAARFTTVRFATARFAAVPSVVEVAATPPRLGGTSRDGATADATAAGCAGTPGDSPTAGGSTVGAPACSAVATPGC
jgi:hypothetical protein